MIRTRTIFVADIILRQARANAPQLEVEQVELRDGLRLVAITWGVGPLACGEGIALIFSDEAPA